MHTMFRTGFRTAGAVIAAGALMFTAACGGDSPDTQTPQGAGEALSQLSSVVNALPTDLVEQADGDGSADATDGDIADDADNTDDADTSGPDALTPDTGADDATGCDALLTLNTNMISVIGNPDLDHAFVTKTFKPVEPFMDTYPAEVATAVTDLRDATEKLAELPTVTQDDFRESGMPDAQNAFELSMISYCTGADPNSAG